jgi:methionine-rich copper-binding protein CopC
MAAPARVLLLLAAAATCVLSALLPVTARAHASLDRSVPADHAQLVTPPAQVDLYFVQALVQSHNGTYAQVYDGSGKTVSGESRIDARDGKHLIVPLTRSLDAGAYTVFWKTTSDEDGGVSLGNLSFFVQPVDQQLVSQVPVGGQVFVPDADAARALSQPVRERGSTSPLAVGVSAGIGGVVLGALAAWAVVRRARRRAEVPRSGAARPVRR